MSDAPAKKMSVTTVAMILVVTTFGILNVIDNLAEMGLASIPSWVVVGFLYFLPLALILAEFGSAGGEGGIYSYMERGLGPTWAFVGTWSYFAANLVYLQGSFTRLPIRMSLAVSGTDVFADAAVLLPFLGVLLCVALTWVSTRGVGVFSHFADGMGKVTLVMTGLLILLPFVFVLTGARESATTFTREALTPRFDTEYFSTFSWLLFAVAGAEVAAPYVNRMRDRKHGYPRAILASTVLIALLYILGSIAVCLAFPVAELTKATGLYDVWNVIGNVVGVPGGAVARVALTLVVITSIAALIVWMESPIRAMFADLPKGTFPTSLTRHDAEGTHHRALWVQAGVVCAFTLLPLLSIVAGIGASEDFLTLLNDLSSLSLVIPYVFIALAYMRARHQGMKAPFQMVRSTPLAIAIGAVVLVVSVAGYAGAGLFALEADPVDWIYVGVVYGGPGLLILLGLGLRALSLRAHRA